MTLAALAFVTAPSATPTVTLSLLAPPPSWIMVDGFTLGAPSFEGGPYSVGAEYGERTVEFTVQITGTYAQAATTMQAISRQLTSPDSAFLMFQWQPTNKPMFLRTYRSTLDPVDWQDSGAGIWTLPVRLVCDAFLWGPRQDLSSVTITADPSTGSNRLAADLGTVLGDVETPAYIWRAGAATTGQTRLLVCEHGAAPSSPPAIQAESGSSLTDTTTTADATASGGSMKRIDFGTLPILVIRTGALQVPANEPGLYRIFARVRASSASATFQFRFSDGGGHGDTVDWVPPSTASTWTMADLGLFQFPPVSTLRDNGLTGAPLTRDTAALGSLAVGRTTGSGTLDVDFIVAIPAYGSMSFAAADGPVSASSTSVWDGYAEDVFLYNGTGTPWASPTFLSGVSYVWYGGLPMLTPGVTNRLWYVDYLGPLPGATGTGHVLTTSTTLNVSYWPKYLHARPDAG